MTARALVLGLLVAGAARAEAPSTDARRLFLAGRQAFRGGRYDLAISCFEAANRLVPVPQMQLNLAQAWRKKFLVEGDAAALRDAVDGYRRFLRDAPQASAADRELAAQALTDLVPLLARAPRPSEPPPPAEEASRTELLVVTEVDDARVSLDGAPPAPAPLQAKVAPGPHRALVEADGYFPTELKLVAVAGRLVSGEARLSPRPGRLVVDGVRGARLFVDGRGAGELPLSAPLEEPAGHHRLAVTARGREPWVHDLELGRDARLTLRAVQPPTLQRRASRWLAATALASLVASVVPAAVWLQADLAASDLDRRRTTVGITAGELADYQDDRARRDAWRAGTVVALSLTAAVALVSAALYLFDHPQPAL